MSTQETALAADSVESFDQLLNLFGRYSTSTNPNKTSANSDLLDRANTLLSARLSLIPILPGTKRPPHGFTWKEFQTRLATPNEVHDWLQKYPGCGFGIVCGKISGNLEVLDLEGIADLETFESEIEKRSPGLLSRLPSVRTPSGGRHLYYRSSIIEGNQKLAERPVTAIMEELAHFGEGSNDQIVSKKKGHRLIDGTWCEIRTLIETRGEGGMVLCPLCPIGVHPNGGIYELLCGNLEFIPEISPGERDSLLEASRACNEFVDESRAKGLKEADRPYSEGQRWESTRPGDDYNKRSGFLDRVRALLTEKGWTFLHNGRQGEQWSRPGVTDHGSATLFHSGVLHVFTVNAAPLRAGESYYPFGLYAELEFNGDYQAAASALRRQGFGTRTGIRRTGAAAHSSALTDEDWPEPKNLPCGLLEVSELQENLLPMRLRSWLADVAERLQVPLDFAAIPATIAMGSVIGNQVGIHPKRHDDWLVVPNLWGAIVGRPGVMKTPAINEALEPLRMLAKDAEAAFEKAKIEWNFENQAAEAQRAALRRKVKEAAQSGQDLEVFRAAMTTPAPKMPVERRYIVNDATVEKYGELLNQNPIGLLIFRDELTGWFRQLDDERNANDRAFYLETWDGNGDYTYDRIGRGTLKISSTTTSIMGGIQPGPFEVYLRGALKLGRGDDGLMQRFQLSVYPDIKGEWKNVDRPPRSDARREAFDLFRWLNEVGKIDIGAEARSDGRGVLRFAPEAQELFDDFLARLERDLRAGKFEHPALESHFAKYRSLLPSLALIFHLCEISTGRSVGPVGLSATQMAASWCTYLISHAKRIYMLGIGASAIHARSLALHLKKGDLPDIFTLREISQRGWSGLSELTTAADAVDLLEGLGWLQAIPSDPGSKGGRPTVKYQVNPRIREVNL